MEWISVNDRLPDDGQEVLIYTNGDVVQAYLSDDYWKGSYNVTSNMNDGYVSDRRISKRGTNFDFVTHWMPLPEPPTNL